MAVSRIAQFCPRFLFVRIYDKFSPLKSRRNVARSITRSMGFKLPCLTKPQRHETRQRLRMTKPIVPRILSYVILALVGVWALPARAADTPLTVGFVYVGPKDDYGYNQAHAQGAKALASVPGVKIVEEEN